MPRRFNVIIPICRWARSIRRWHTTSTTSKRWTVTSRTGTNAPPGSGPERESRRAVEASGAGPAPVSIKLYMNHHVDVAITEGLRRRGVDVLTCHDDGTTTWDDDRLLDRASQLGRVFFSQDDDLLAIAHRWQHGNRSSAGLVYGHQLDLSIGEAVRDLELIAGVYDPDDIRDRVEYLPL